MFTHNFFELYFLVILLDGLGMTSFYSFFGEPAKDLFLYVSLE